MVVANETSNSLASAPRIKTSPNKFASLISLEGEEEVLIDSSKEVKLMDIMTSSGKRILEKYRLGHQQKIGRFTCNLRMVDEKTEDVGTITVKSNSFVKHVEN